MTAEQNKRHVVAATEMVTNCLRIAWARLAAKRSTGRESLILATRDPEPADEAVKTKLGAELYAMTVRAVQAEVVVERLEHELAHAKADTERVALSDLSARQRASREELAAFEAALKPMTELGQSLIKWAESWGHELQATLIDDLERLDAAMRPLTHGMRQTYRDAGSPHGDTEEGMLQWWGEQVDRAGADPNAKADPDPDPDPDGDLAHQESTGEEGEAHGDPTATSESESFGAKVRRFSRGRQA